MNRNGTTSTERPSLYTVLELVNERIESLALIINQMSDNQGFYARQPVNQTQIDQFFAKLD